MARNFFNNLPSTTTPLTAPRLNGLLDGDEAMGNIVVDSIRGKNLFNEETITDNYAVDKSNGNLASDGAYVSSDYIEVEASTNYYCNYTIFSSSYYGLAYYNSSKTFISGASLTNQITTPANTKYIRFCVRKTTPNTTDLNTLQFEKGTSATTYASYQGIGYTRGKNSNGEYIKYDDGTLICHMTVDKSGYETASASYTEVQGIKWYRSYLPDINFPISFIDRTYQVSVIPYMEGQAGSRLIVPKLASKTVSKIIVQFISVEDFTSSGTAYTNLTSVDVIAIGRWK